MQTIVDDPAAVTSEWLTAVLEHAGRSGVVVGFTREAVGTGQMAHNERYRLELEDADPRTPRSLVIKFPSPNEESRAAGAAGGYRNEVRFYTDLAADLAIAVPECLYGAVSDDSSTFTLVLEDLAPARQGDQIDGAGDDRVVAAVRNLAGLHAPRWGDPALAEIEWLQSSGGEAIGFVELVTPMFIERYETRLSDRARMVFEEFGARVGNWVERESAVKTLVHGDYRLDNLMFATTGDAPSVSAVDWQTIGLGAGGRDLGYLLGNSAPPEARRRHEPVALDAYREEMARLGVELGADTVMDQYRHGTFQGPFITMLGSIAVGQTDRGDEMFMAMAERSAAQIVDLDALDLIR